MANEAKSLGLKLLERAVREADCHHSLQRRAVRDALCHGEQVPVEVVEHRDLDDAIARLSEGPFVDQIQLRRMKKRKLLIKDQIAWLESHLIPDLDA